MIIETPNGKYKIDETDCYIRNHMMSGNVFEYDIINFVIEKFMKHCKYVVDVGANIGCHGISYALSNKDSIVYAFEPQTETFDILKENVSLNGLDDRMNVYNYGLAHKDYSCTLRDKEELRDDNCNGWNKGGIGIGKGGESIHVKSLDSLKLPGLDFLKIDVEGAEGLVIMGAKRTIEIYKPVILFEHNYQRINPEDVGLTHVPTPFEELVKLGYRNFHYLTAENYITWC